MPNARVHRPVGAAAGVAFAAYRAKDLPLAQLFVELLGGAAGGWFGAYLPDKLDPPTSPNHRHHAHGIGNYAIGAVHVAEYLTGLQQRLRQKADELQAQRMYLANDFEKFFNWLQEIALRFLVGLLNGVPAGYISHLALDACTPKGIPVFARGF